MDERTIVPILSKFRHFSMLLQFIINCNGFHHSSKTCTNKGCCPKCSAEVGPGHPVHLISNCHPEKPTCVNCVKLNHRQLIVIYTISGIKAILQDSSVKIADDEGVSPSSSVITRVSCNML
jgi:hypothetical protein